MTTQLLANELANLVQESKRKHNDLRQAAERSLDELKALKGMSESQAAAELANRPSFVNPLIIACGTKSPKFTSPAIVCLQRLVAARALPPSKLDQVLEALRGAAEAGSSGPLSSSGGGSSGGGGGGGVGGVVGGAPVVDAQLKILQALPALLANYADDICGGLLVAVLDVCFVLQSSRNGIVNNTAAATLQQLVVAVFEKVVVEDKNGDAAVAGEVETKQGTVKLGPAALDAHRVFNDLCLMTEGLHPNHLRASPLPQTFGLELVESVLTQHAALFATHTEQASVLRDRVMPLIISTLKRNPNFATTVRLARILYTLLRRHLALLPQESGDALEILTQLLDGDTALWKRAVCIEVFRGVFAEAALLRRIFALYDAAQGKDGSGGRPILKTLTATLVRVSTEKPVVIGLGHQSTIPVSIQNTSSTSTDQAILETGIIGSTGGDYGAAVNTGVSAQWSSVRVPCIDQLDKTEAPPIPESYIYSLTLTCISSLSEGMAKFILPLTVPSEHRARRKGGARDGGRDSPAPLSEGYHRPLSRERSASFKKNPIPLNPLSNAEHPLHAEVQTCAAIVDECWPAVLATCSTFLYAALDSEYYHSLVRAFQKFAHVAGLLQLPTPRDAFLTTLGKVAVPPNVFTACLNAGPARSGSVSSTSEGQSASSAAAAVASGILSNARGLLSVESLSTTATSDRRPSSGAEPSPTTLNTRNLLCLRALLNLGIALGPTLGSSWSIIIETLQQADFVLFCSGKTAGRTMPVVRGQDAQAEAESNALLANFGGEVRAVETAASRLVESTVDFPNGAFVEVVDAICSLLDHKGAAPPLFEGNPDQSGSSRPVTPMSGSRTPTQGQHRRLDGLGGPSSLSAGSQEDQFALAKLGDIAHINIERLLSYPPDVSGWTPLTRELIRVLNASNANATVRARATDILVRLVLDAASLAANLDPQPRGRIQLRLLEAFRDALVPLQATDRASSVAHHAADVDIHRVMIEGLKSLLENCGEGIVSGWEVAFEVIGSIFVQGGDDVVGEGGDKKERRRLVTRSARLIRSAFSSLQLICSDFLASLPNSCFLILVDTLYRFCSQDDDLNIALTTVTFFWVVSDFLSGKHKSLAITAALVSSTTTTTDLASMAANENHAGADAADAALWMLLLLRLTTVTSDGRLELRNSAIQTLLRILDAYGDRLSPEAWMVCVESVVFKLLVSIEDELRDAHAARPGTAQEEGVKDGQRSKGAKGGASDWDDTAVVVLNGVADLLASYLDVLTAHPSFDTLWKVLLDHFATLLDFHVLAINTATFKALNQILAQTHAPADSGAGTPASTFGTAAIDAVWDLWARGVPVSNLGAPPPSSRAALPDNQECLVAYVSSLRDVYRLVQANLSVPRVQRMLALLGTVIQSASPSNYTSDVESVSPLQGNVMDAIRAIRTDVPGVPSVIIAEVAQIVALAFSQHMIDSTLANPSIKRTYVAMAKAGMGLLENLILRHAADPDVFTSGALAAALSALARPVALKYAFPTRTAKSPSPWRVATSAALSILEATLPRLVALASFSATTAHPLWDLVATVAAGIVSADCAAATPLDDVALDEEFDIASYLRLRALVVPALGAESVPDRTRARFAECLFRTSIVHSDDAEDLAGENGPLDPVDLAELYKPRRGRTVDPIPTKRTAMAYVCLDELFSLTASRSSSSSSSSSGPEPPPSPQPAILIHPPTPIRTTAPSSDDDIFPPLTLSHPPEPPAKLHLRMARAVAPFLLLRCALVLRAYAADQPLRGRMPQPVSRRRELVHILTSLVALRSEGGALHSEGGSEATDGDGGTGKSGGGERRRHLVRLYPLIVRVGKVVGWRGMEGDELVGGLVGNALEVVGEEVVC